jgi:hypothetical protein
MILKTDVELICDMVPILPLAASKRNTGPKDAGTANVLGTNGDRYLSAWLVAPGVCWIQTRSPFYARKLEQRADSRLVARGVAGGFLRTFEFNHGLAWAERLLARYAKNGVPTKAAALSPASPPRNQSRQSGSHGQLPPSKPSPRKPRL